MTTASVRVLHVITDLESAGAQGVLLRLLRSLRPRDHAVVALSSGGALEPDFRALGVEVYTLSLDPTRPNPLAFLRLRTIVRRFEPDLVQTWLYHADLIGGLVARSTNTPVVWNLRHSDLSRETVRRSTMGIARACAISSKILPDRIVCCSRRTVDTHAAYGYDQSRMVLIPNGFDCTVFRPNSIAAQTIRNELGIPKGSRVVTYAARFSPQKDHETFFRALALLHDDMHVILCGERTVATNVALKRLVSTYSGHPHVHLLGVRNDMPAIWSATDVAVLSSLGGEGFPNVLGEAMACGTPVATTDVGDARSIVGNTGEVVLPRDPSALAAAISTLFGRVNAGEEARLRIQRRFSLSQMTERYREVWHGVAVHQ